MQSNSPVYASLQDLLDCAVQAEGLSLKSQHIRHVQAGQHLSSLRGRGMEFDELRQYQNGDDIRGIDWKVTARTGMTHTKLFREERERPVVFWMDLRPNMFFATRVAYKSVIAAKVVAYLSWAAYRNKDRIGGFLFSDEQHVEVRPRSGRGALTNWFHQLSTNPCWDSGREPKAHNPQNWQSALQRLSMAVHHGSLVFLISDFLDLTHEDQPYLAKLARHNDVALLQINDPVEIELPDTQGLHIVHDQQQVYVNTRLKKNRDTYRDNYTKQQDIIKTLCRRLSIRHLQILTNDQPIDVLRTHYRSRR